MQILFIFSLFCRCIFWEYFQTQRIDNMRNDKQIIFMAGGVGSRLYFSFLKIRLEIMCKVVGSITEM